MSPSVPLEWCNCHVFIDKFHWEVSAHKRSSQNAEAMHKPADMCDTWLHVGPKTVRMSKLTHRINKCGCEQVILESYPHGNAMCNMALMDMCSSYWDSDLCLSKLATVSQPNI